MDISKDIKIIELADIYGCLLTGRQLEMFKMYYNYDISLSEIAENFSVTRQAVRDCLIKCKKQLLNYEDKLNIFKNRQKILKAVDVILEKCDDALLKPEILKIKEFL